MRARDLALPCPTVRPTTPAREALELLAGQRLPGLIVVDDAHRPTTILSGTDLLKTAVPGYCQQDPALARVVDEATADVLLKSLELTSVAALLPETRRELPVVDDDATALEIAALMARSRSPLVAVVDDDGALLGAVTLEALLEQVLAP